MTDTMQLAAPMDTDEFLEHFGIKGMKWGVHHQPNSVRTAARQERFQKRADRGESTLRAANAFNSPSVAIGMKTVGLLMAGASAAMAIRSLRNPTPGAFRRIKIGMTVAGLAMTGVQAASIARDIGDVNAYTKSTQGRGAR